MSTGNIQGPKVAGLILAAGESTRMGRPKQLLAIKGRPLICRVVEMSLASLLDKTVVVLGHQAQRVKEALEGHGLTSKVIIVENEHYKRGMGTSIRAGLTAVKDTIDHVMIILADMAHIDSNLINILLTNYLDSGKDLGAVKIQGRRSHPVVFSKRYFQELLGLDSDKGGRQIFAAHEQSALMVDAGAAYREIDLDTPEDYEEFRKNRP
ncbi:MAG: nucleotidyltransferase family protein [Deltaproteobacteria bacterium]|nr:nucleotidyltransferase family protein [Deltaproteobacteria bacterium]